MSIPRPLIPAAVVGVFFVLTFAIHQKVLTAPMQYDSAALLKGNEYLFNSGVAEVIKIFPQRPLAMITFYINYLSAGMNPYYFRLVNAFLMACAAGVVVLLLVFILEIPGIKVHGSPGQKRVVSFCLGLVFLLHPATIYVVVYIWQRMALLSGLFFFLALAAYLGTRTGRVTNSAVGYAVSAVMFFLAMASKENAISLPAVLVLVELAFFKATLKDLLRRSVVFVCVALMAVIALSFIERPHGHMVEYGGILSTLARYYKESGLTPAQVVLGQCVVLFEYLRMVVLPVPSNVHFMNAQLVPSSIIEPPMTAVAVAGVVTLTCFAGFFLLRLRPLMGFGALFFILNLLPEALMAPQYLFFGYRVFVPMFGLLLIAADGILFLIDLPKGQRWKLAMKAGLITAFAAALALLSLGTVSKEALWMDPIAFWKDVRGRLPDDKRVEKHIKIQALDNLGYHLRAAGKPDQAIVLHREAMQVDRRIAFTYLCLAAAYFQAGQLDDAVSTYRELLGLEGANAAGHAGLARVLQKQNRLDEALEHYRKALERKPYHPDYNYGIADIWLMKNDYGAAMPYMQRTIKHNPRHVEAHYNIGKILMDAGKDAEAIDHFNAAIATNPLFWMAHNNLGVLIAKTGRLPEAIDHFHEALKINPEDVPTRRNLETALETLGAAKRR